MNITGRLTRDAEVRTLENEKQLVSFSVAVNESYRNKGGERVTRTEFFDCAYWRSTGVASVLTKGTIVELTGWISPRAWKDMDGAIRAGLNFRASDIRLLGGGRKQSEAEDKPQTKGKAPKPKKEDDDLPF